MTKEEIVALLDRRDKGWQLKDPKLLASPYADDAVLESPISGKSVGRPAIADAYERLLDAWSPLEYRREDLLVDGDQIVICFEIKGTHTGEFLTLPATGKKFTIRGVTNITVSDGKFTHERRVYDVTGLMVKLGVLKASIR